MFFTTLFIIQSMVFSPSRCFLYLTFFLGGVQLWRDEKDLCLAALEDVYEFIAPVTHGKFFSRTRHFVQMFVLVFFKFWFFFSLIRPYFPDIQPVCADFKVFLFFFCIFFKLLDYVLVWRQICNSNLINDLHNSAYYMCGRSILKIF